LIEKDIQSRIHKTKTTEKCHELKSLLGDLGVNSRNLANYKTTITPKPPNWGLAFHLLMI